MRTLSTVWKVRHASQRAGQSIGVPGRGQTLLIKITLRSGTGGAGLSRWLGRQEEALELSE